MATVEKPDNLYSELDPSYENETKPLGELLFKCLDGYMRGIHTAHPGQITRVKGNQKVDVQPMLLRTYRDGSQIALPIIQDALVIVSRGTSYGERLPLEVGDTGIILFSERSLDVWSVSGGIVDPQDPRHHDLADAIFIPGLYPFSDQVEGESTDLIRYNGDMKFTMKPDGTFRLENTANELMDLLTQTVQAIIDLTVLVPAGTLNPASVAAFTLLKAKLETLKG